jgi:hypothetical protein
MSLVDGRFGDFEQVAEAAGAYQAEFMALRLRAEGIEAQVVDQTYYQEPMPSVRALSVARVLVPNADAERARGLLATLEPLPDDVEVQAGDDSDPDVAG